MLKKEERDQIDKETLDLMILDLSYSLPLEEKDLKQSFYKGQVTMLYKLSQMLIGHNIGSGFTGVITEDQLEELEKELNNK